jgi:hypothetical protein
VSGWADALWGGNGSGCSKPRRRTSLDGMDSSGSLVVRASVDHDSRADEQRRLRLRHQPAESIKQRVDVSHLKSYA